MTPPLFGSKKKGKSPQAPAPAPSPAPDAETAGLQEPLEFREVPGAPAAASPPQAETLPAAVGAARALRATRPATRVPLDRAPARPPRPAAKHGKAASGASATPAKKPAKKGKARKAKPARKAAKPAKKGKAKKAGKAKRRR